MGAIDYVCTEDKGRLDRYLADELRETSRSEIQRWIEQGRVTVNDQIVKSSHSLSTGDMVHIEPPDPAKDEILAVEMALTVVYQDRDCIVIDKPPGLVVHPATSHRKDTLVNGLLAAYPEMAEMANPEQIGGMRPGIVHRLDKDTSGLIVVARHASAKRALQAQFKARTVKKRYLALVHGWLTPPERQVSAPIGRDLGNRKRMAVVSQGKNARTIYRTRQYLVVPHGSHERYTLVEIGLPTGRTHQIRVHSAYIGHPVVGDQTYGRRRKRLACPRQFLHAYRLAFDRISDGQRLTLESALPDDLRQVLDQLAEAV
jgi:23S rRNA pseudouridine1911/1915/1917 synthase